MSCAARARPTRVACPDGGSMAYLLGEPRGLAQCATSCGDFVVPEIGIGSAIAQESVPAGAGLIIAIEATGYEGPTTARTSRVLPDWSVAAAARSGASAVKLLLYYHPDSPTAPGQEALLRRVADECREVGRPLFVEPLSYSL